MTSWDSDGGPAGTPRFNADGTPIVIDDVELWGTAERAKSAEYWALVAGLYKKLGSAKFFAKFEAARDRAMVDGARTRGIKAASEVGLEFDKFKAAVKAATQFTNERGWHINPYHYAQKAAEYMAGQPERDAWNAEHNAPTPMIDLGELAQLQQQEQQAQFWDSWQGGRYRHVAAQIRRHM